MAYILPTIFRSSHQFFERSSPKLSSSGVAPTRSVPANDHDEAADSEETSEFNAESHFKFFTMSFLSTTVNLIVGVCVLCGKPCFSGTNHKIHLELNLVIK